MFAAATYGIGADVGFGCPGGIPVTHKYFFSKYSVPGANAWTYAKHPVSGFIIDAEPKVGDIAGFHNDPEGHDAIYIGGTAGKGGDGLLIYPDGNVVKVQTIKFVMINNKEPYPVFSRYTK
jgi:hypothetical protein